MQQYKGNKENRNWWDLRMLDSHKLANHRAALKVNLKKLETGNFAWSENAESIKKSIAQTRKVIAYLEKRLRETIKEKKRERRLTA